MMPLCSLGADWTGKTALIAGSGPSQDSNDLHYAKGKCRVVVLNSTWKLAPWADMLYACDQHWWQLHGPKPGHFKGLRVIGKGEFDGCVTAHCIPGGLIMIWDGHSIGGGWNSGFQALNLLALWRVSRVILTGMDCQAEPSKPHWHGKYTDGKCSNPEQRHFDKWIRAFTMAVPALEDRGVEVLNASRETALEAFPRVQLRDVL